MSKKFAQNIQHQKNAAVFGARRNKKNQNTAKYSVLFNISTTSFLDLICILDLQ